MTTDAPVEADVLGFSGDGWPSVSTCEGDYTSNRCNLSGERRKQAESARDRGARDRQVGGQTDKVVSSEEKDKERAT